MTLSQPAAGAGAPVLTRIMAWLAVIALGFTALAWLPASLAMPLGRDQGIFAWVVLQGGTPYADAWELKGPAAHYLFALAMAVFSETALGIRLFDAVVMGATMVALTWIVRPRGQAAWGCIAGLLIFAQFGGDFSATAQPDGWVACGALVAAALVWQERTRASAFAAVVVGVLLGLAVLTKPNYALLGVVPLVGYAWRDPAGRRHFANVLWCALGAAAVAAALAVPFVLRGQIAAAWDALVVFNLESHVTSRPLTLRVLFESLSDPGQNPFAVWLVHAMAVFGFAGLWRRDRRGAVLLAIGWLAGWAVGVSQNKGFHYHFMAICRRPRRRCAGRRHEHGSVISRPAPNAEHRRCARHPAGAGPAAHSYRRRLVDVRRGRAHDCRLRSAVLRISGQAWLLPSRHPCCRHLLARQSATR